MATSRAATSPSPSPGADGVTLLFDLFGYLSIVLHGLTITAQAATLGGIFFILLLARPLSPLLGIAGPGIARMAARTAGWAAILLVLGEAATLALQCAVLVATVELSPMQALGAAFALAGLVKIAAAALLARGICRGLEQLGYASLLEFPLANGRRADVLALEIGRASCRERG